MDYLFCIIDGSRRLRSLFGWLEGRIQIIGRKSRIGLVSCPGVMIMSKIGLGLLRNLITWQIRCWRLVHVIIGVLLIIVVVNDGIVSHR